MDLPADQMYKVLITTSGTGSRLKDLTRNTNKALIKINNKPIIDYIITCYPEDIELVITIGYKGNEVKEYVQKTYPHRKITFVQIDKYEGEGSSLGYSMLQAQDYLQCPFIFHCNDTIVTNPILSPTAENWNAGSRGTNPNLYNTTHYSSFLAKNDKMIQINPKKATAYDYFHIGLVGINEYQKFWHYLQLSYQNNPNDQTLNDVIAINLMLKNGSQFTAKEFKTWYDTGNLDGLAYAEKLLK